MGLHACRKLNTLKRTMSFCLKRDCVSFVIKIRLLLPRNVRNDWKGVKTPPGWSGRGLYGNSSLIILSSGKTHHLSTTLLRLSGMQVFFLLPTIGELNRSPPLPQKEFGIFPPFLQFEDVGQLTSGQGSSVKHVTWFVDLERFGRKFALPSSCILVCLRSVWEGGQQNPTNDGRVFLDGPFGWLHCLCVFPSD